MTDFLSEVHCTDGSINYKLAVAHEEMNPRRRNTMEDCHRILHALDDDESYSYFGVYDGHGGRQIVDFLEDTLEKNISTELKHDDDASVLERLTRAFLITDMQSKRLNITTSGSTAVVALIKSIKHSADVDKNGDAAAIPSATAVQSDDEKNHHAPPQERYLYVANVGDSRAVLYQQCINRFCTNLVRPVTECPYIYVISDVETTEHGFYARRLTRDHKADDEDEQQRIKEAGGFIVRSRVLGILAVSRSFGDHGMKDFVTAHPHTTETCLSSCGECPILILACDGVWDVFTDQEAADLLLMRYREMGNQPFQDAAKLLVQAALDRGSADNVTAIVIFL